MGEYLTVIFIVSLYLAELSGKVVILCLHTLERARQCRLIKFRAIHFRLDHFSESKMNMLIIILVGTLPVRIISSLVWL